MSTTPAPAGRATSQDSALQHVGLGSHEGPVDVEVRWPGGTVNRVTGLEVRDTHTLASD